MPLAVIVALLAAGTARAGRWKASYRFRGRPGIFELGYSPTTTVRVR